MIDWRSHIHTDPAVLGGKPVFKGTRLSVAHLLELQAHGWSDADLLENYPSLQPVHLLALRAYVYEALEDGLLAPVL